jgi:hypothetical protein
MLPDPDPHQNPRHGGLKMSSNCFKSKFFTLINIDSTCPYEVARVENIARRIGIPDPDSYQHKICGAATERCIFRTKRPREKKFKLHTTNIMHSVFVRSLAGTHH